jgi:hypothetical protein
MAIHVENCALVYLVLGAVRARHSSISDRAGSSPVTVS